MRFPIASIPAMSCRLKIFRLVQLSLYNWTVTLFYAPTDKGLIVKVGVSFTTKLK